MTATDDAVKQSLEQVTSLTRNWLELPGLQMGSNAFGANVQKFTAFATDLQQLYANAYQRHMDPLLKGNKEIADQFTALMHSQNPKDVADFQLEMLGQMMEGASVRAQIWGDLANEVGRRYAQLVRDLSGEVPSAGADKASKTAARKAG